jgi:hypothetical protein
VAVLARLSNCGVRRFVASEYDRARTAADDTHSLYVLVISLLGTLISLPASRGT